MGDSGILIPNNPCPVAEVEVKSPTSINPFPVAVVDVETGLFLSPGKEPAKIFLLPNKLVVFEDHEQYRTSEHGNWHKWYNHFDGTQMLSITFHYNGSYLADDLIAHVFRCLVPGVYRMQNQKQVVFFHEEFKDGKTKEPLSLDMQKKDVGVEIEKVYLWLHPERPPAVLLITPKSQIVYHEIQHGAKRRRLCTSVPNGSYVYSDTGTITTCFHCHGEPTFLKTVLNRIDDSTPVWRAAYDKRSNLIPWHIVMIPLEIDGNVIFWF